MQTHILEGTEYGNPVRRKRRYTVLLHHQKVARWIPYQDFCDEMKCKCGITFHDMLVADDGAKDRELTWASQLLWGLEECERYFVARCNVPTDRMGIPRADSPWLRESSKAKWVPLESAFKFRGLSRPHRAVLA